MLVGIAGYATAGKDAVADALVADHHFSKRAMSDALNAVLYATNPEVCVGRRWLRWQYRRLRDIVDELGWTEAKARYPEIRGMQQRLGTEGGRTHLYEDVWVDAAFNRQPKRLVLTGIRYENEAEAVVKRGGSLWRVERPGVGPANGHKSETALDAWPFDRIIVNDGSLADLRRVVAKLVDEPVVAS